VTLVDEILKMSPAKGDVIVLKLAKDHPNMGELWDQMDELADKDFTVLALTNDIDLSIIDGDSDYLLTFAHGIPAEHEERIRVELAQRLPDARIGIVNGGGGVLSRADPEDGLDTL